MMRSRFLPFGRMISACRWAPRRPCRRQPGPSFAPLPARHCSPLSRDHHPHGRHRQAPRCSRVTCRCIFAHPLPMARISLGMLTVRAGNGAERAGLGSSLATVPHERPRAPSRRLPATAPVHGQGRRGGLGNDGRAWSRNRAIMSGHRPIRTRKVRLPSSLLNARGATSRTPNFRGTLLSVSNHGRNCIRRAAQCRCEGCPPCPETRRGDDNSTACAARVVTAHKQREGGGFIVRRPVGGAVSRAWAGTRGGSAAAVPPARS